MQEKNHGISTLCFLIKLFNFTEYFTFSALVKWLLTKGSDINAKNSDGWNALHYAARYSDGATVKFLLKKGANFETQTNSSLTSLHLAASHSRLSVLQAIWSAFQSLEDADLNYHGDKFGFTPMHR